MPGATLHCTADIDECAQKMACQGNLTCTNTVGSYTCSCPSDAAGECEHPCTALHGVTSKTPRLQKAESASCIVYSHPTGESLGCGTACRSRSCPEGFCSNGGRCHLHPPSCTPTCECPPAFTDRHCVVAGGDFQPQASAGGCCAPRGAVTHPSSPSPETQRHHCSFVPRSAPKERAAVGQGTAKCHS